MKRLLKKFETAMTAASFAEAGEHKTAREIMAEIKPEQREEVRISWFERAMMAVSFAEAGEADTAREIMREGKRTRKADRVAPRPRKQLRA